MQRNCTSAHEAIFPGCRRVLKQESWDRSLAALGKGARPEDFPDFLSARLSEMPLPQYLPELARLEWQLYLVKEQPAFPRPTVDRISVNPTLKLHPVSWKKLVPLAQGAPVDKAPPPARAPAHVMIWRCGKTGALLAAEAAPEDLLALKLVVEGIGLREAAVAAGVPVVALQTAIDRAVARGILLAPPSALRRDFPAPFRPDARDKAFLAADVFTLQWHITQTCDLHCRHCYDRSDRPPLAREAAMGILDEFDRFCRRMNVSGQVTFTGGNPLLYPHLDDVYREASQRGFTLVILGNPSPLERIRKLAEIQEPALFQISLEGLEAHNDYIRGPGHFRRSLDFLDGLRSLGIYAMVMLTLTRDNLDQVLPLADFLRGRADHFSFNRLSMVGEGAALALPAKQDFVAFLERYEAAARNEPLLGLKDNLINIIRLRNSGELLGGCTGYGCGAGFNFVSLLPDGDVHACRKFPSCIGNLNNDSLFDIYHSPLARRYRQGPEACRGCSLLAVCRGCLAAAHSLGRDVFKDKDPFCFM